MPNKKPYSLIEALDIIGIDTFEKREAWWWDQFEEFQESGISGNEVPQALRRLADWSEAIWATKEQE